MSHLRSIAEHGLIAKMEEPRNHAVTHIEGVSGSPVPIGIAIAVEVASNCDAGNEVVSERVEKPVSPDSSSEVDQLEKIVAAHMTTFSNQIYAKINELEDKQQCQLLALQHQVNQALQTFNVQVHQFESNFERINSMLLQNASDLQDVAKFVAALRSESAISMPHAISGVVSIEQTRWNGSHGGQHDWQRPASRNPVNSQDEPLVTDVPIPCELTQPAMFATQKSGLNSSSQISHAEPASANVGVKPCQFPPGSDVSMWVEPRAPTSKVSSKKLDPRQPLGDKKEGLQCFQDFDTSQGSADLMLHVNDVCTLMLKDIPCSCTKQDVLNAIESLGFGESYRFFHMPGRKCNLGYAFVGFEDKDVAALFASAITGYQFQGRNSKKCCSVAPARIQGLQQNAAVVRSRKSSGSIPTFSM